MKKLEAAARKRGEPVTLVELAAKHPPIADADNAAVAIMGIWEKDEPEFWMAFRAGTRPLPDHRPTVYDPNLPFLGRKAAAVSRLGGLSPESRAAAEAFVGSNTVRSAAIQDALRNHSKVQFPVQITDGAAALLPHLAMVRQESQCLRIAALLATEVGKVPDTISILQDSLRLANALKDEPVLISQLVRIAIQLGMLTECERLVSRHALAAGDLDQLAAMLESMEMSGALKTSFISERAFSLSVYEMSGPTLKALEPSAGAADDEAFNPYHAHLGIQLLNLTGIVSADRRFMLETMEQVLGHAETNSSESLAAVEAIFDHLETQKLSFPPKFISALMLPGLGKATTKFAAFEARRRSALVALAIERYRLENHRPPARLDELTPKYMAQVPTDPFDGRPLRYQSLEKGFVVYSVGSDRIDNSGRERPAKGKPGQFDETFCIER